jgi:hypothetical protein
MPEVPDLWPKEILDAEPVLTPFSILKKQAVALADRTKGLIEAKVVRVRDDDDDFHYSFKLVAPSINYSYTLFTAWHEPITLYPVNGMFLENHTECDTQDAFLNWLKSVFASIETRRVINGLLIQVKEGTPDE